MNSNIDDEKLDALLDQWADQGDSSERLVNLQKRIVSSLQETKFVATADLASKDSRRNTQHRVARNQWASRFAVGTVVTMLLTVGFVLPQWGRPVVSPTADLIPEYAWLQEEQIQNKSVLLAEMESLFDQQLAWHGRHVGEQAVPHWLALGQVQRVAERPRPRLDPAIGGLARRTSRGFRQAPGRTPPACSAR